MRKRKAALVLCAAAALSLAACSSQETGEQTSSSQTQTTGGAAGTDGTDTAGSGSTSVSGGRILIAYFSVPRQMAWIRKPVQAVCQRTARSWEIMNTLPD